MLVEQGALAGDRGAYRVVRDVRTLHVPATVQAILAARIDRLSPEDKRLLQAASAIGKDVPFAVLRAVDERSEEQCREGLARLQAAELLYEARLFPDLEYTFKHALTHEVAYQSLVLDRRRHLHARIAAAIERFHAERLGEQVERMAYHAVRGEEWDKAFVYLRRAGAKAAERLALAEAAAALEQAVSVAGRLPERRELITESIDLHVALRGVLFPLGEFDKLRSHLEEAARLAEAIGDQARLALVTVFQTHYHGIIAGNMAPAIASASRAMEIARTTGSPAVQGAARFALGQVQHSSGQFAGAAETLIANVELFQGELGNERGGFPAPLGVLSRVWLAFGYAEVGRFADGLAMATTAIEQAESLAQPYGIYHAYWARAAVHLAKGDHDKAIEAVTRIGRINGEAFPLIENVAGLVGYAEALTGKLGEAVARLESAAVGNRRPRNAFTGKRDVLYLGEAYLQAKQLDRALEAARDALADAAASGQRGNEARAHLLVGEVQAAVGSCVEAEQSYRAALALATELGMRPLAARCHLDLAALLGGSEDAGEARGHLETARAMLREMGMRYWLQRADEVSSALER